MMTTTSTAPPATIGALSTQVKIALPTWVTNWETIIKAHEKIIIVGILAITGFFTYSKGISAWDRHDSRTAQAAAAVVKTDDATTKATAAQLAALQETVATQTAMINKQIAQRAVTTIAQQKIDRTLPPSALASRWETILGLSNGAVTPNGVIDPVTGQQFAVTEAAAVATVVQLEVIPELTADKAALQIELSNDASIITTQTTLIGNLNTELKDEKKSHVKDVNVEKAKTKHAFIRGLEYGFVAGFAAGAYVGHLF
jgi:hypothetical protein